MAWLQEKIVPGLLFTVLFGLYILWSGAQRTFPRWKSWAALITTWRSTTVQYNLTSPEAIPSSQRQRLDDIQRHFEMMEFHNLGDFVLHVKGLQATPESLNSSTAPLAAPHISSLQEVATTIYCRAMENRKVCCNFLVQIVEEQNSQKHSPTRYTLFSRSGDMSYATSSYAREIHWLCEPRALWSEISLGYLKKQYPDQSLWALANVHATSCNFISQETPLEWEAPLSLEQVAAQERENFERLRVFASRRSAASFIWWAIRTRRESRGSWLGELTDRLKSK